MERPPVEEERAASRLGQSVDEAHRGEEAVVPAPRIGHQDERRDYEPEGRDHEEQRRERVIHGGLDQSASAAAPARNGLFRPNSSILRSSVGRLISRS